MFIRHRGYTVKDGSKRRNHALLEARNVDGKSRHFTLLNLGTDFKIPRSQWTALISHVKDRLKGQLSLPGHVDDACAQAVEDIADQLDQIGYNVYRKSVKHCFIDPEKTTHPDSRTFAGERVALHALRRMGFDQILLDMGLTEKWAKLACALVVAHMLNPSGEPQALEWMTKTSTILDLALPCSHEFDLAMRYESIFDLFLGCYGWQRCTLYHVIHPL